MKQNWNERELIESWTLTDSEKQLLQQRTKRNRLGFAILLKFFQIEARFPTFYKEVPKTALDFLADQIAISTDLWFNYPVVCDFLIVVPNQRVVTSSVLVTGT